MTRRPVILKDVCFRVTPITDFDTVRDHRLKPEFRVPRLRILS
jgi:hypothetical protein